MRKEINIPDNLKDAVELIREALNLSYIDSTYRRNVRPKTKDFDKEYSFSATLCYLVQLGIDKHYKNINLINTSLWINKQNLIKFKELIETAYQKSLDFNIDSPHRNIRR